MLISFAVTAKLICVFVFAYADCWFSREAAHLFCNMHNAVRLSILSTYFRANFRSKFGQVIRYLLCYLIQRKYTCNCKIIKLKGFVVGQHVIILIYKYGIAAGTLTRQNAEFDFKHYLPPLVDDRFESP